MVGERSRDTRMIHSTGNIMHVIDKAYGYHTDDCENGLVVTNPNNVHNFPRFVLVCHGLTVE